MIHKAFKEHCSEIGQTETHEEYRLGFYSGYLWATDEAEQLRARVAELEGVVAEFDGELEAMHTKHLARVAELEQQLEESKQACNGIHAQGFRDGVAAAKKRLKEE